MLILHAKTLSRPGIAHGFFGRRGGVSEGIYASLNCGPGSGDDRAKVIENRRRATQALGAEALLEIDHGLERRVIVLDMFPEKPGNRRAVAPGADGDRVVLPPGHRWQDNVTGLPVRA